MSVPSDALDLQVLKRVDPDVDEVLATAGHVCLYYMHVTSQQWTRKNVEGSLFLLKRKKNPRFQMMVLNKLATDNYIETIHGSFDFEVNAPYLMYTHGNSEIHGIWFYEEDDLHRLSALLNRVKAGLPKADIMPNTELQPAQSQPKQQPQQQGGDTSFWDKQVEAPSGGVPHNPGMQAAAAPPQQAPAEAAPVASPPLLPPSFFGQQQAVPASGGVPPQPASGDTNTLQKLFAKAAAPQQQQQQQQQPVVAAQPAVLAPPAPPAPPQAAPIASPANPLSKLFVSPAPGRPGAPQQPQPPPAEVAAPGAPPVVARAKVRAAFSRLLSNDAFVDMLCTEFRAAGLMAD